MVEPQVPANGRHSPRGRPFAKGNPGRLPGSKNKATLIATSLLEDEAEDLIRTAIDLAKAGDKDMLKFLLGRVLPKERAIRLELPSVNSTAKAVTALAAVTAARFDRRDHPFGGSTPGFADRILLTHD